MKKNNTLKRFLAFLLCAAMIITYMPSSVYTLADDGSDEVATEKVVEKPAQVEKVEEPAPEVAPEPEKAEESASAPAEEATPAEKTEPEAKSESAEPAEADPGTVEEEASPEDAAEKEPVEEEPEEDEVKYPAQNFNGSTSDVDVTVRAPKGAFPEGTTMKVKNVANWRVNGAVQDELGNNAKVVKAVDITFYDADGKEIEPKDGKVLSVSFNSAKFATKDDYSVVHIDDNNNVDKVSDKVVDNNGKEVAFKADEFSVYAVVDQGENARLKVVYMNGNDTIATQYVKKADYDNNRVDEVLYDPGVGDLPEGVTFRGWTTDANYTADTTPLTIKDIQDAAAGTSWDTIKDGDEEGGAVTTYYAMLFKHYEITYVAEGVTLGREQVFYLASETNPNCSYKVNQAYTPADNQHRFDGWKAIEGGNHIEGNTDTSVYTNGTVISINGNVTFGVEQSEGNWLVFDENGKGATYNAPQFILKGQNTSDENLLEMVRNGYTFGGWYDSKAHADAHGADTSVTEGAFTFGGPLTERTTIYASWIPKTQAPYTVIFWTQNQGRTGYEVKASVVVENGRVGQNIPYTSVDNGDEDYATVTGTTEGHYTGFCLKEDSKNQQITITPEGDAVLNLYYDRIVYNFKFYLYRNGTTNNRYDYANNSGTGSSLDGLVTWHSNQTEHPSVTGYTIQSETVGGRTYYYFVMQAYYGEDISSKWPTYDKITGANGRDPVSYVMMVGTALKPNATSSGSGTVKGVISVLNENILGKTNDSNGNYVFVRFPGNYNHWRYHIWYETVDGED